MLNMLPNQENKTQNNQTPNQWLIILGLAGIGLIGMALTSNSILGDLTDDFSNTLKDSSDTTISNRTDCSVEAQQKVYIESGRLVTVTPAPECFIDINAEDVASAMIGKDEEETKEPEYSAKELFDMVSEYTIRTELNKRDELTAQIESIVPLEAQYLTENLYQLQIHVNTLESSRLPYSLTVQKNEADDSWKITNVLQKS